MNEGAEFILPTVPRHLEIISGGQTCANHCAHAHDCARDVIGVLLAQVDSGGRQNVRFGASFTDMLRQHVRSTKDPKKVFFR